MSKYNPKIHHRRSIRLKGYDYSKAGAYFITICCQNRICRFGQIVGTSDENNQPQMILNEYGQIAYDEWMKLPDRFNNFELDVFQIMPNHMHAIIVLKSEGAGLAPAPISDLSEMDSPEIGQPRGVPRQTVGDIVGAYKSLVSNNCLDIFQKNNQIMGKLWQRNYHEHIIRNEQSYERISKYIMNNPANWNKDKFWND